MTFDKAQSPRTASGLSQIDAKGEPHVYVTIQFERECECKDPHKRHGSFIWAGAAEPVKHTITAVVIHEER